MNVKLNMMHIYQTIFNRKAMLPYMNLKRSSLNVHRNACHKKQESRSDIQKPWINKDVRSLIQQRRDEHNPHRRSYLSKELRKKIRQEMRKWKTMRAHAILQKFENLNDLQKLREVPRKSSPKDDHENDVFADFLA